MRDHLIGTKIYLQPVATVLNVINDLVEMQKGKQIFCDAKHGKIHFIVSMYGSKWEFRFTVKDIGKNRCRVKLEIEGESMDKESMLQREISLLDTALVVRAKIELDAENDDGNEQG